MEKAEARTYEVSLQDILLDIFQPQEKSHMMHFFPYIKCLEVTGKRLFDLKGTTLDLKLMGSSNLLFPPFI